MVSRIRFFRVVGQTFTWGFLLALAVVVLYPLVWMFLSGLKTNTELFGNPFALPVSWNWNNYVKAWNTGVSDYLRMSVLLTITSTISTVMISAWAAYGLTRVRLPFSGIVVGIILGGLMLAPTVAVVPLLQLFENIGLYNTFWALLILYTAFRIPFSVFLIRAYMLNLPREVDEAAAIDGASRWTTFWSVVLPMSRPILVTTVLMNVLFAWNEYLFAVIFTSTDDVRTLPVGLTTLMSKHGTDFPVVFAAMVIAALPVIILFFAGQRYLIRGLSEGIGK
jgi:raffinose/stachyose/melibiose transport system permease protein